MPTKKHFLFRTLLVLLVLGAVTFAEIVSRIFIPYPAERKPKNESTYVLESNTLGHHLLSSSKFVLDRATYTTNSLGFRDREFEIKPDEIRVAFLGDSFIEGMGEPQEETIPKNIEKLFLANTTDNVFVMNAGIRGGSPSIFRLWIKALEKYSPDMYLIAVFPNDLADDADRLLNKSYVRSVSWWSLPKPLRQINLASHARAYLAYLSLKMRRGKIAENLFGDSNFVRGQKVSSRGPYDIANHGHGHLFDPAGWEPHWNRTKNHLTFISEYMEKKSTPWMLVFIPTEETFVFKKNGSLKEVRKDFLHNQVLSWSNENQIPIIDLKEKIATWYKNGGEALYDRTHHFHFNATGLRNVSRWIYADIMSNGVFLTPPKG